MGGENEVGSVSSRLKSRDYTYTTCLQTTQTTALAQVWAVWNKILEIHFEIHHAPMPMVTVPVA